MSSYNTGLQGVSIDVMDTPISAAAVLPYLRPTHLCAECDLHHFRQHQIQLHPPPPPTHPHTHQPTHPKNLREGHSRITPSISIIEIEYLI